MKGILIFSRSCKVVFRPFLIQPKAFLRTSSYMSSPFVICLILKSVLKLFIIVCLINQELCRAFLNRIIKLLKIFSCMSSPCYLILLLCDSHKKFTKLMKTITLTMKTGTCPMKRVSSMLFLRFLFFSWFFSINHFHNYFLSYLNELVTNLFPNV